MVIIPIISSRDYRWAIDELQWLLTRIIAIFMHKCSKHQGPRAQVIHMDLDHVINSTAVIGNMKLQSQVTCWCYQHCCCNPKGFQNTVPILFQYLTKKVLLWFSWLFYTMNLLLPHNHTFYHPSHNSLQLQGFLNLNPPWHMGLLSSRGIGGVWRPGRLQIDPLAPRNLTGEQNTHLKTTL